MTKFLALIAILFAFAAPSAFAKNDYSCDKKFIFFPGGPEGGPFGTIVYNLWFSWRLSNETNNPRSKRNGYCNYYNEYSITYNRSRL